MLVSAKKSLDKEIVSIKFSSGEEIIAKVVNDDRANNSITVINPLMLVMLTDETSQGTIIFAPWILSAKTEDPISINMLSVVSINPAREDAISEYNLAVGPTDPQPKVKSSEVSVVAARGGRGGRGASM